MLEYLSEESFVALLYFEFDFKAMMLTVISAGINLFLASEHHECTLVPISSCYLGIFEQADMQRVTLPFKQGDIYCMMSDGLSDLIEMHGITKQQGLIEYADWLQKMTKNPDRTDDCSAICIEIVQKNKEFCILSINNEQELLQAQQLMSEFLLRNTPTHATMLEVAVNEAVNNGFRVGGMVCVKMRRVGATLIIRVRDDGPGFSTRAVNLHLQTAMDDEEFDDAFDEVVLESNGRGILLMKMLCDRLTYNAKGNEVLLMKRI